NCVCPARGSPPRDGVRDSCQPLEIDMAITHPHSADALPVAMFARAVNALATTLRAIVNRRQYLRLHEMSDHELSDIGLQRSDLHDAWARRLDLEPTRYLDALVRSRGDVRAPQRRVS